MIWTLPVPRYKTPQTSMSLPIEAFEGQCRSSHRRPKARVHPDLDTLHVIYELLDAGRLGG